MSLSTLRARAMELISRGMEQNLRRSSARATYPPENAYGSATHRVFSDGVEMADESGKLVRVCSCAVADIISVSCVVAPNAPAGRQGGVTGVPAASGRYNCSSAM